MFRWHLPNLKPTTKFANGCFFSRDSLLMGCPLPKRGPHWTPQDGPPNIDLVLWKTRPATDPKWEIQSDSKTEIFPCLVKWLKSDILSPKCQFRVTLGVKMPIFSHFLVTPESLYTHWKRSLFGLFWVRLCIFSVCVCSWARVPRI